MRIPARKLIALGFIATVVAGGLSVTGARHGDTIDTVDFDRVVRPTIPGPH